MTTAGNKIPISREGLEEKVARLREVERELNSVIPQMFKAARANEADLRENNEYKDIHELRQQRMSERVKILELIEKAEVVSCTGGVAPKSVGLLNTVSLESSCKRFEVQVVSPAEVDLTAGKISSVSPLGSALIGRHKGERVKCRAPKGPQSFKILGISA